MKTLWAVRSTGSSSADWGRWSTGSLFESWEDACREMEGRKRAIDDYHGPCYLGRWRGKNDYSAKFCEQRFSGELGDGLGGEMVGIFEVAFVESQ